MADLLPFSSVEFVGNSVAVKGLATALHELDCVVYPEQYRYRSPDQIVQNLTVSPDSVIGVGVAETGTIVGYICLYPVRNRTAIRGYAGEVVDVDLSADDILRVDEVYSGAPVAYLLMSVVVRPEWRDTFVAKMLSSMLGEFISRKIEEGVNVTRVLAFAIGGDGYKWLSRNGFALNWTDSESGVSFMVLGKDEIGELQSSEVE